MEVTVAVTDTPVPLSFTAWGSYSLDDNPSSGNVAMILTVEELHLAATHNFPVSFDGLGTWSSSVNRLPTGTYSLNASYSASGGGTVNAPAQTNIQAANGNPQPPLPPSAPVSPPLPGKPVA